MGIKIKKENHVDRKFDIPEFKSSEEINREFDNNQKRDSSSKPEATVKVSKHEDDLELTTQLITTELSTDELNTLEVDTIDIENDIKQIEQEQHPKGPIDEDTITIGNNDYIELDEEIEAPNPIRINIKYIWLFVIILFLLIGGGVGYKLYQNATSQERFLQKALEDSYPLDSIEVYGESVNLLTADAVDSVELYNLETKEKTSQKLGKSIDDQLHFSGVPAGEYYLFVDDKIATSDKPIDVGYQTITRDGSNQDIKFSLGDEGEIVTTITKATNPKVDILIDASQGLVQGFTAADNVTSEQQLSLKYALALKSQLQAFGYNVKLTRSDDSVPGGCNYQDAYCDTGRVAMAYIDNPKLYIQIGFNGQGGSGFEITDSTLSSHTLSRLLKTSLQSVLTPSERVSGQLEPGVYNRIYETDDGQKMDYLYLIRETGGIIMNSDNEDAAPFNQNLVGTEAVAIDLGYMGESTDFKQLDEQSEIDSIAKAMASAIDQYIHQY